MTEEDIDEAVANYPSSSRFNTAEKLALRYSELMALDPDRIDSAFYERLHQHYADEEIVELGAFIGFNVTLRHAGLHAHAWNVSAQTPNRYFVISH